MTRLLINLFFIMVICFSLAIMPINTEVLDFFSFSDLFTSENVEEPEVQEKVDDSFVAIYDVDLSINNKNRIYNPEYSTVTLTTNIPKEYEANFIFDDMKFTLYKNDVIYQTFSFNEFVTNYEIKYVNNFVEVNYELNLNYDYLKLSKDGFYEAGVFFTTNDKSKSLGETKFSIAYRNNIDYVVNGQTQNNGNFIYKAFFLNEAETHLVPLYFSVKYPESITVEVRNRLYNLPPADSGLSQSAIIPKRSNIAKLADKHYGVFLYSDELASVVQDNEKANLTTSALIKTLARLPHITKLTFFVDDAQIEGSLYDFDLSKVYENTVQSYVYLTETTSTGKNYLVPVPVNESNIYDEIWTIFRILKSGEADDRIWTEIIPPEIIVNNFIIDGTTITVDFNEAFLTAYEDFDDYRTLMLNSILYSLTSIENINKVIFTVNNDQVMSLGNFDLSAPLGAPPYINFIGEY